MKRRIIDNEPMGLKNGRLGIKHIASEQRVYPKSFGQCGRFSFSETIKEYVRDKGIVIRVIDYKVFYSCSHEANPSNIGNRCSNGFFVCKDCITMCEICGQYLCLVPGCCNPVILEGRVSCQGHLQFYGLKKLLGVI